MQPALRGGAALNTAGGGWERPYHEPGGGDAVLSYVIFGSFSSPEVSLDQAKYRSAGAPPGCELQLRRRADEAPWFQGFVTGHLGRLLDEQIPAQARLVREAPSCMTLLGTVPDPPSLDYLRDAVGLITSLLDGGAVAVLDGFGLQWWSPEQWRRDLFEPNDPVVLRHAGIVVSEDNPDPSGRKTVWLYTRGMSKFGRPDISIHQVTEDLVNPAVGLINRLIILQALGGLVPEGEPVVAPDLPPSWKCRHAGSLDDPRFNNVHLEIG